MWVQTALERWPEPGEATIAGDPGTGFPIVTPSRFSPAATAATSRLDAFRCLVDDYTEYATFPPATHLGTVGRPSLRDPGGPDSPGDHRRPTHGRARSSPTPLGGTRTPTCSGGAVARRTALPPELDRIDWENDPQDIAAWQQGRTGYPIVDAGMRQLATTGWMHNRVRMIVASFLVKDLLVHWRIGERWFRRPLVDAGHRPERRGTGSGWQAPGPDAAYFRIFNPVRQSQKVRPHRRLHPRFVPELAEVPATWIHAPWMARPSSWHRSASPSTTATPIGSLITPPPGMEPATYAAAAPERPAGDSRARSPDRTGGSRHPTPSRSGPASNATLMRDAQPFASSATEGEV